MQINLTVLNTIYSHNHHCDSKMATNEVTQKYMYITFATTIFVKFDFLRPGNFMRQIIISILSYDEKN